MAGDLRALGREQPGCQGPFPEAMRMSFPQPHRALRGEVSRQADVAAAGHTAPEAALLAQLEPATRSHMRPRAQDTG